MFDFNGKTVLVTGGGAGIGRAAADAFAQAGARLAIVEIDPTRAEDAKRALGSDALVVTGDVTDKAVVADLARQVDAAFGGLDVLVNNVGDFLQLARPFDMLSDEEVERLYLVNLGQIFSVTRAMIPLLKKKGPGGSIVSVSSIEGFRGIPNCVVYAACKAGLTGFTKSLSLELGPHGIRVNLIAPETTDTPQVPVLAMIADEHKQDIARWTPLGRFGTVDDMASGILFLASPHAAWITGTALHIDGGALAAAGWYRDRNETWTNVPVITGNGFNF